MLYLLQTAIIENKTFLLVQSYGADPVPSDKNRDYYPDGHRLLLRSSKQLTTAE